MRWARPCSESELTEILEGLKRAPAQYALLCRWIEGGGEERNKTDFLAETGASPAVLKALCDKGILMIEERRVSRLKEETGGAGGLQHVVGAAGKGVAGHSDGV